MTGEQPTRGQIISAVQQVLREFAPSTDSQDTHDFLEELWGCDWDELEVNIGRRLWPVRRGRGGM